MHHTFFIGHVNFGLIEEKNGLHICDDNVSISQYFLVLYVKYFSHESKFSLDLHLCMVIDS